jgi:hypothetical protein
MPKVHPSRTASLAMQSSSILSWSALRKSGYGLPHLLPTTVWHSKTSHTTSISWMLYHSVVGQHIRARLQDHMGSKQRLGVRLRRSGVNYQDLIWRISRDEYENDRTVWIPSGSACSKFSDGLGQWFHSTTLKAFGHGVCMPRPLMVMVGAFRFIRSSLWRVYPAIAFIFRQVSAIF